MKLKMIETMLEDLVIDTIFILVRLVSLLPTKVQKQVFLIIDLLPILSCGENTIDE